jgi:hypothetical protein
MKVVERPDISSLKGVKSGLTKGSKTKAEATLLSQICFTVLAGVGPFFK